MNWSTLVAYGEQFEIFSRYVLPGSESLTMNPFLVFALTFLSTAVLVRSAIPLGVKAGLVDVPGGRRTHTAVTPLVGGISMYIGLLLTDVTLLYFQLSAVSGGLLVASGLLVLVGVLDDRFALAVRARFVVQITAALIMILQSGLVLQNLGELLPGISIDLGWLATPFTILAVVAVINATNMLDGVDGLAGSLALVCLLLMAAASFVAGMPQHYSVLLIFSGMLGGFLLYNFRFKQAHKARVFMGDAGSMFLGFVLVWFFVELSQGKQQVFAPITAVWIFSVPLFDTAAVILRRIRYGSSPFKADRTHLHHFLMDGGFSVRDAVLILVSTQILMGLIGLAGFYWEVPDFFMLLAFLGLFGVYFAGILHTWRFVTALQNFRQILKATAKYEGKIFVGNLSTNSASFDIQKLLGKQLASVSGYRLFNRLTDDGREISYCIMDYSGETNTLIRSMKMQLSADSRIVVRPLYVRGKTHDRRARDLPVAEGSDRRGRDRRVGDHELVEHVNGEWLSLLTRLRAYGSDLRESLNSKARRQHHESQSRHQKLVELNQRLEKLELMLADKRKDREKAVAIFADSKRAIALHDTVIKQLFRDEVLSEGQTGEQGLLVWNQLLTHLQAEQGRLDSCRAELNGKLGRLQKLEGHQDKPSLYRDASEVQGGILVMETECDKLDKTIKDNEIKLIEARIAIKRLEDFVNCYESEFSAVSKRCLQIEKIANSLAQQISTLVYKKQILQQQKKVIELDVVEGAIDESRLRMECENIRFFDKPGQIDTRELSLDELRQHYNQAHQQYEKQCIDFAQGKGALMPSSPYQDTVIACEQKLENLGVALNAVKFRQLRAKENLDMVDTQLQGMFKRGERLLDLGAN